MFDDLLKNLFSGGWIEVATVIVGGLLVLASIFALCVSIYLAIKYVKFNRRENSAGLTGVETARKVLDANGLQHIAVKTVGSLLFGNSYSHYFKKVRLRRLTRHKKSVTALGMGAQKAALAVLDKEGDSDMKMRIRLFPIITFGPFMFIPLIVIGVLLDLLLFNASGVMTVVFGVIGMLFYVFSLVLSILTLKTEKKAQARAYDILKEQNMATDEELSMLKELFTLYNIEYINNIIISTLELIYYVLRFAGQFSSSNSGSNN